MRPGRRMVPAVVSAMLLLFGPAAARADGDLARVKHIIILMQENHSFDNYFGALPYAPDGPYHAGPCTERDHACVDGLSCAPDSTGNLVCANTNLDDDGTSVAAFHLQDVCLKSDLNHEWLGSHREANFADPRNTLASSPNDGFVRVNDATDQPDTLGGETSTDDQTMGFYTQAELPFYYALAETFAINDRYFASVMGPTFPNRAYALAATSFGHLDTLEQVPPLVPPPGGYRPVTGTILDLLDQQGVFWVNYFSDAPTTGSFRPFLSEHLRPISQFFSDAAKGRLPPVAFVDPAFGFGGVETDEHPPSNIQVGQFFVSQIVQAVRNSPDWKHSILFITYDEHGGFHDHVQPPRARQGGARTPDGIFPGQCVDADNPVPGTPDANCTVSELDAASLCPAFTATAPYPADCPAFEQYGFRVPFIAVSPFAKPQYVSHTVGDHTSLLALIEKRFFKRGGVHPHLTARDRDASTLEDMFDFQGSPSLNALVPPAPAVTTQGCVP